LDKATLIGIPSGIAVILIAIAIGENPIMFVSIPGVLIVVFGTLALTLSMITFKQFIGSFKVLKQALSGRDDDPEALIERIEELANIARKEGALALEDQEIDDPFLAKGIGMIVDGQAIEVIERTLERDIQMSEARHEGGIKMFSNIVEVAPAMGMLGTLVGLVQMLGVLDDPDAIGPAMATALLTTFYGILIAQGLANPIARKLELRAEQEARDHSLIMEGIRGIQEGINPRILRGILETYLPRHQRASGDEDE